MSQTAVLDRRRPADPVVDELHRQELLGRDFTNDVIGVRDFLKGSLTARQERYTKSLVSKRMKLTMAQQKSSKITSRQEEIAGVILRVALVNFMCHSNFELELGPKLNFIIGHNGSGKSAILTAISVCLGAKASDTNRATNLGSLVKEGENMGQVTVTLANRGRGAYRHDVFGDEITIQRTFRKTTAVCPYIIKNQKGERVSEKKAELDAILDYFHIAVNNPMCFLSQDSARDFLTATSDEMKYQMFMKGTMMTEVESNYRACEEQFYQVRNRIVKIQDDTRALRKEAEEARALHDKLNSSKGWKTRVHVLKGKFFWMRYDETVRAIEQVEEELRSKRDTIEEINAKVIIHTERIKEVSSTFDALKEKKNKDVEILEGLKEGYKAKKREMAKAMDKHDAIESKLQGIKDGVAEMTSSIERLERDISKEEVRLAQASGGSLSALREAVEDIKSQERQKHEVIDELKHQFENVDLRYNPEIQALETQIDDSNHEVRSLNTQIEQLGRESNTLSLYPRQIQNLCKMVRNTTFRDKVIGPIGLHMKMKPGQDKWLKMVNAAIGGMTSAFLVRNTADRAKLASIAGRSGLKQFQIYVRSPEQFDYLHGCPRPEFTTVLSVLEFDDPDVLYLMIDMGSIERCVLFEDRQDAQRTVEQRERNVSSALALINDRSGSRASVNALGAFRTDPIFYNTSRMRILPGRGDTSALKAHVDVLKEQIENLAAFKTNLQDQVRAEKEKIRKEIDLLNQELKTLRLDLRQFEKKIAERDTGRLEILKEDLQHRTQDRDVNSRAIDDLQHDLYKQAKEVDFSSIGYEELQEDVKEKQRRLMNHDEKIIEKQTEHEKCIRHRDHYKAKVIVLEKEIEDMCDTVPEWEAKRDEHLKQAEEYCDREKADDVNIRSTEEIQRETERLEQIIREHMVQFEISEQEILEKDEKCRDKYIDAFSRYQEAVESLTLLRTSLEKRLQSFKVGRAITFIEADREFRRSLDHRKFDGRLNFNYAAGKLKMMVGTKNDKTLRHVKTLSGGEKSFSQISLLLATWKPMKSRIRGLDEFDVFMDQMNRRLGMALMLSRLGAPEEGQTIFITPQDVSSMLGDVEQVKIHRVRDPRAS